ncbi:polymer-forming cytoskeletal protein [Hyphomonas sp.]|uniref:bactofilin family protein n=1 Tax=Hyphomonas sp. TaxID=87 RepID=UPI00391DD2DB
MFTKNNKPAPPPAAEAQKPVPAQEAVRGAVTKSAARAASIICADMRINGSVTSEGALQIDGIVDGDVSATDITIGASGQITGEVKAEVVKVKGKIKGSIRARKVELETGAHVKGDIVHSSLQIQSNAVFEGQVKHAEDPLRDTGPVAASDVKPSASASAPAAAGNGNGNGHGGTVGAPPVAPPG